VAVVKRHIHCSWQWLFLRAPGRYWIGTIPVSRDSYSIHKREVPVASEQVYRRPIGLAWSNSYSYCSSLGVRLYPALVMRLVIVIPALGHKRISFIEEVRCP
jgi:hypothetical protein